MADALAQLHVFMAKTPQPQLEAAIRRLYAEDGFIPVPTAVDYVRLGGRSVTLVPGARGRWITVLDERVEGSVEGNLRVTARRLADAALRPVVSADVEFDELITLGLHRPCLPEVVWTSNPNFGASDGDQSVPKVDPVPWQDVAILDDVWLLWCDDLRQDRTNAETHLRKLAGSFGWRAETMLVSPQTVPHVLPAEAFTPMYFGSVARLASRGG